MCDKNEEKAPEQGTESAVREYGTESLPIWQSDIHVLSVMGQVEGHAVLPPQNKTTKYEHVIPQLVAVEESPDIKGLLVILNTVGGDVEAGLAISEMLSTMKKPVVSLVLGGGHSIGVPIAVSARHTVMARSATMTIHPVRMSGLVIGVPQSYEYLDRMQDRVINFVVAHSRVKEETFRQMMFKMGELAHDVGTVCDAKEALSVGLIDEIGGLREALSALRKMMEERPCFTIQS